MYDMEPSVTAALQVMKDLGHENIVRFYTVFHEKTASYLALEFIGGGGQNFYISYLPLDAKPGPAGSMTISTISLQNSSTLSSSGRGIRASG